MIKINNTKLCESCFRETDKMPCPECGFSPSEYSPDPTVLPMGTRLNGKIIIGRVMGKGGFGVTYLGYDMRMEKTICVKEYYPNGIAYRVPGSAEISLNDPKSAETFEMGAEKFYAEAEMSAQFNGNPNIVSVYDYFRANNTVYLIMEFLQGVTLKNYVKNHGRLSDGQALYVMDKITAALSITHSAGILHRDISPDNIMICRDGKVKLIDFGAARQIMAESSSDLTVIMKPGYTPIEQYTKKGRQGAWTDIYSLGASIYYALTTVIIDDPYARIDSDEEFAENKHGINNDLWNILKKCTMISSADRYGSAIDLRKALKSVSEPMKAEPIVLADGDLNESSKTAHKKTEAFKTEKKESSAAADSENAEAIQRFETENVPQSDKKPILKFAEKIHLKKPKSKKPFIIGIAAAVVLIGVVGIFAAFGNSGKGVTAAEPLYIPLNEVYQGDWRYSRPILRADLNDFEGDIKITLDVSLIQEDAFAVLQFEDNSRNPIDIRAYNMGRNFENRYSFYKGQTKFAFVVTKEVFDSIESDIQIKGQNVWVKGAAVENYDPAKDEPSPDAQIIQLDSEYPGWWIDSAAIPKSVLEAFNGDVRITLDIEYVKRDLVPEKEEDNRANEYWLQIQAKGDLTTIDRTIFLNADYVTPCSWYAGMYVLYDYAVPDRFTFVITTDQIAKLDENRGLFFAGTNFIAKSAALEKA